MKGFRKRDYFIAAVIILGVMSIWFLVFAMIFGLVAGEIGLPLCVAIGFLLYWFFWRKPEKNKQK